MAPPAGAQPGPAKPQPWVAKRTWPVQKVGAESGHRQFRWTWTVVGVVVVERTEAPANWMAPFVEDAGLLEQDEDHELF